VFSDCLVRACLGKMINFTSKSGPQTRSSLTDASTIVEVVQVDLRGNEDALFYWVLSLGLSRASLGKCSSFSTTKWRK
jgi:hypothetical protein